MFNLKFLNIFKTSPKNKKLKKLKKKYKKINKRNNLQINFKTNKIKKNHIIIASMIIFLIIIFSGFHFLKIKTISIIKTDSLSNISLSYNAVDKYRGKSLFLVDKEKIKKSLIEYQKSLKNISITRLPPSTLKIEIESYRPIFKTIINDKNYIITKNGVVIFTNKKNKDLDILKIKTDKKYNFPDYKQLLNPVFLNNIVYIKNKLNDNLLDVNIEDISYYVIEREAHFKINNNTLLIFDLNKAPDKQIEKIIIFNKEYSKLSKPGIVYIDLRVKNKIFYCKSETEYTCKKNLEYIYKKEIDK